MEPIFSPSLAVDGAGAGDAGGALVGGAEAGIDG